MDATAEKALWALGLLAAGGAVVGGAVVVHNAQAAATTTPSQNPTPNAPPPPGSPPGTTTPPGQPSGVVQAAQVTLAPGTVTANVGVNQSLTLIALGTIQSIARVVNGAGFRAGPITVNASTYSVSDFTNAGSYTYNVLWLNSSGTQQSTTVQITAS